MVRMMAACTSLLLVAGTFLSTPNGRSGTVWYVDDDAPNDPGPGDPTVSDPNENGSSEHPFDAIQEGIDAATNGDTVLVLDGTYTGPENRNLRFYGNAITVRSASGDPPTCIIDCEKDGTGFVFESGEGTDSVVEGLTIKNGTGHDPGEGRRYGGAVYCRNSSPMITNCTLSGNSAHYDGGAVYCRNSSPTVTNCTISANEADFGGGVHCWENSNPMVTNCTISGNGADYGGGVYCWENSNPTIANCTISANGVWVYAAGVYCYSSSPTITNCTISGNSVHEGGLDGGGVYVRDHSSPTITDCTISGNSARDGGGVYCWEYSSATITNCTISANEAWRFGGGVHCYVSDPTITNCTISGNSVHEEGLDGGGIYCYSSNPTITNCTISGNWVQGEGGGVYCEAFSSPTITNCILWNDLPQEILVLSGSPAVTYSDVQGGWPGTGNIDADPLFVDPDGLDNDPNTVADNDYHLLPGSPCIDAADNDGAPADAADLDNDGDTDEPTPLDLDRRLRFADRIDTPDTGNPGAPGPPIVDMGAYEYQCSGDLDGNGVIDLSDLATLLGNYGATSGAVYPDGDLDRDGDIDLADLATLLAVYGTTCP